MDHPIALAHARLDLPSFLSSFLQSLLPSLSSYKTTESLEIDGKTRESVPSGEQFFLSVGESFLGYASRMGTEPRVVNPNGQPEYARKMKCPFCGHENIIEGMSNSEIYRRTFRCTECWTQFKGRAFWDGGWRGRK